MYVLADYIHKAEIKLKAFGKHTDTSGNKVMVHGPTVVVEKVGSCPPPGLHFTILVIDTPYESLKYKLPGAIMA